MFKNIPIVTRLIFLVSVITLLMLGTIIYATNDGLRSMARLDDDMQQTLNNVQAFERINFLMADTRIALLDAALNPEPSNVERRIADFQKNRAAVTEQSKKYEATLQDARQLELLNAWKAHRSTYAKEAIDPLAAALLAGKTADAARLVLYQVAQLNEPIRADIDSIRSYNLELQEKRTAEVNAASSRTQYFSIALVIALTVISGLLAWTIIRTISNSLNALQGTISRIATGDTHARANLKTKDELGLLANQFDKMMDEREAVQAAIKKENDELNSSVLSLLQAVAQLAKKDLTVRVPVNENVTGAIADALNLLTNETAKVMADVNNISADVTRASMTVQSKAETLLAGAQKDRDEADRTAASLESAAQSMHNIANLAQACNAVADNAIKSTQQALSTVNNTVSGINSTRDVIRETEKRIKRLGERSQEISGVVNLINVIAERTHILALNASMHAASAGEAGRGFAVVADEVQRLAENARQATQQISALVSNIQLETADTASTMNNAITQIVEGSRLAEQAGQQMQITQQNTAELVDSVRQIATTSEIQAQAGQVLRDSAVQIKRSSQQATDQLHEQAAQTSNLLDYAKQLLGAVRVFKLPV
ncbi:MAG: methyl-accepting chemotaxis protein [Nitrosomonadales bacterium]|nr:methyl-accepting chemotaxis protein [Nitrosomonadales bacterium]